ncbi:hypothetical protein D3C87_1691010 [compost metagenome]
MIIHRGPGFQAFNRGEPVGPKIGHMLRRARQREAGIGSGHLFGLRVGVAAAKRQVGGRVPGRREFDTLNDGVVDIVVVPEPIVRILAPAHRIS